MALHLSNGSLRYCGQRLHTKPELNPVVLDADTSQLPLCVVVAMDFEKRRVGFAVEGGAFVWAPTPVLDAACPGTGFWPMSAQPFVQFAAVQIPCRTKGAKPYICHSHWCFCSKVLDVEGTAVALAGHALATAECGDGARPCFRVHCFKTRDAQTISDCPLPVPFEVDGTDDFDQYADRLYALESVGDWLNTGARAPTDKHNHDPPRRRRTTTRVPTVGRPTIINVLNGTCTVPARSSRGQLLSRKSCLIMLAGTCVRVVIDAVV